MSSSLYRNLESGATLLARTMAVIGGLALLALIVLVCISVTGRGLTFAGLGPVHGDFEWVELGVGFAVFAFLPWAQLNHTHARVDLFTPVFGKRFNAFLDLAADILMSIASTVIAWRLWLGLLDKHKYGETTFIIHLPVWIGYAAGLVGAVSFAIISVFCVLRSIRAMMGVADERL